MMSIYLRNLTFILFILFLLPAQAVQEEEEVRYYDIELIVYENQEPAAEGSTPEISTKMADLMVPENNITLGHPLTIKLDPQYDPQYSFKLLTAEELRLKQELQSLKETEQYKILLHTGWRQPGLPRDKALEVYFKHAIADSAQSDEPETETSAFNPIEAIPVAAPVTDTEQAAAASESEEPGAITPIANLQGIIKIVLSRYLHTDIELVYKKVTADEAIDRFDSDYLENRAGKDQVYYLKQNRRMRSKELHYIDHPVLGVLVKITPYKVEKPAETIPPANDGAATPDKRVTKPKVPG